MTVLGWFALACGGPDGAMTSGGSSSTSTEEGTDTVSDASVGPIDSSGGVATGTGSATGSTTTPDPDSSGGDPTTGGPSGSVGCGQPSPGTGMHSVALDFDGDNRSYELFVPSSYDPDQPTPLVLNFHGYLGSPLGQVTFSQFNDFAEQYGMIVAYPAGIGASFNAGRCCGEAQSSGVDDVGFSKTIVAHVSVGMCVDPARVYATGMSNGGHMSHRLACEAADVFAAVASVAGLMGLPPASCQPGRPISVMQFHGTSDLIVPYNGIGPGYPAADDMMVDWAARNGCSGTPEVTLDRDEVLCETWPDCGDGVEVTLCTIDGGGHCWPGVGGCPFGYSTTDIHASGMIAAMFSSQSHPNP